MIVKKNIETQIQQLIEWYGEGNDGSCPTEQQWTNILSLPTAEPITLINFFKIRTSAQYPDSAPQEASGISGMDAFNKYAEVSIPTMEKVGGKFLHVGPFAGSFLGDKEEWDVVAIGSYPNLPALLDLYINPDYRAVFHHRTAACEHQKVLIATQ